MAEKKTTQTKASMRNGRATKGGAVYNANHNTLESIRRDQPHIDAQKFELNRYWKFEQKDRTFSIKKIDGGKGGFDARKHELAIYEKLYGDGLAARNERYTREGHKDRCQTIKNLYSNPKTAPLETIFQIGNSQMILDGVMGPEEMKKKLTEAWNQTMRQLVGMGKGMVIPLDAALHCEEAVPHIHFRAALGATDRYGHFMPNQSAALKAMGFDGRNPDTGKKDRYHNPLVAYTDRVREIFYAECEKQGLVIDREVTSESHRQVEILAFKLEKAKQDIAAAQEQLQKMEREKAEAVRAAQTAQEALEAAQEMEKHQRELFNRQNSRLVREFGTLPAQKEKKNFRGQVTQEARPECVIVAKEDLERVQDQARYNIHVHLTEATIKALDKKISENEIIQGLRNQVEQQRQEINHLRADSERHHQKSQRDDWTIEQLEQTLGAYGIPSPTQQQHQQQHRHR